ncbi:MAG TPA: GNAT family N-acetyltransferase [Micromonosporaceae bacterium]|nr:GNAT family N-acetyltransferase [Micromonosporaceae bacterium]
MVEVHAATADRYADVAALFGTNKITSSCWCMWFVLPAKEVSAGWGEGNRERFAALAGELAEPVGLLAYRDGEPVGWLAAGPRARYARALRSPILKGRDAAEDDRVWLLPCFFVRRDARRAGVTAPLIEAAVDLARSHSATAVEAFPMVPKGRVSAGQAFIGTQGMFAGCGFREVARPSPTRVVMRREL